MPSAVAELQGIKGMVHKCWARWQQQATDDFIASARELVKRRERELAEEAMRKRVHAETQDYLARRDRDRFWNSDEIVFETRYEPEPDFEHIPGPPPRRFDWGQRVGLGLFAVYAGIRIGNKLNGRDQRHR